MIEEPAASPGKRPHSREQLLRLLNDDPRSVSRAEIKAAFADGRLGDQDLDIPVLAGMKRITELLAELDPNAAADPSGGSGGTDGAAGGMGAGAGGSADATGGRETSRAAATSVRIGDIEAKLGLVAERVAALEAKTQDDRATAATRAAAEDEKGQATARTMRVVVAVLLVVVILVVVQLGLRIANG